MLTFLRSLAFSAGMLVTVIAYGALVPLIALLPFARRYAFTRHWARLNLRWLELTCGVRYRLVGQENLPQRPVVVLSKHQSTWETLVFQEIFPPLVWVMKRELLWLPLFGWGLALGRPIAIDRGAGRRAMEQMLSQGQQRLDDGLWVVIFPEGTRMPPGETRRYGISGAALAHDANVPIVPVAHNAGDVWPRLSFVKRPGTVRFVIGPPISAQGRQPRETNLVVQDWIESKMREISVAYGAPPAGGSDT